MIFRRQPRILVQYGSVAIGELTREGDKYIFAYLPAFFDSGLKPLPDFPEPRPGKKYKSARLWPFFSSRIPDVRREDVRELMEQENLKATDEFELLIKLGRETINNPFHLSPAY